MNMKKVNCQRCGQIPKQKVIICEHCVDEIKKLERLLIRISEDEKAKRTAKKRE